MLIGNVFSSLPVQKRLDESHSDINSAFGPHRSVSSQYTDQHLLTSLLEIKYDLGNEVRALNQRMTHIDEQISQIYNFLSPLNPSATAPSSLIESEPKSSAAQPLAVPPMAADPNIVSVSMSPLFETPSFYSDLGARASIFDGPPAMSLVDERHEHRRVSRSGEQMALPAATSVSNPYENLPTLSSSSSSLNYNRSLSSSISNAGISTTPRNSVSNRIAPAPAPPSPTLSAKQPLNTSFQPISNTRFNPGRSPKPKSRSQHGRSASSKHSQQQSTIIDLESSSQQSTPTRTAALPPTPGKPTTMSKSRSSVFRRFMTGSEPTEKSAISSSSTLLYPPTSDDERPMSPLSSGNDDDDYRPLTASTSKYHHQTPL